LADIKRAADSAGAKLTPELKAQLTAAEKEVADVTSQMGAAQGGGRGGAGGGGGGGGGRGAGGAGGGRGGAGGGGIDDEQNAPPAVAPTQTIAARLGTTTEMLGVNFNPNPSQRTAMQTIPAELTKQGDRVTKLATETLPALVQALKSAGIEVKPR